MTHTEVIRLARALGRQILQSKTLQDLQQAEVNLLNDMEAESLRADLQIVEARLLLFDYKDNEERDRLRLRKQELEQELQENVFYRAYEQAREEAELLTKRVLNTVSRSLKEDATAARMSGLPEAEELMQAMAGSPEFKRLHDMHRQILAHDQIQNWLQQAFDLHERIRQRRFQNFAEARKIHEQIDEIEQQLSVHDLYQQYRAARHDVDRMANTVLEILSHMLTGHEHEGGCIKNQHPGPAGIIACEECGKTSVPLRGNTIEG